VSRAAGKIVAAAGAGTVAFSRQVAKTVAVAATGAVAVVRTFVLDLLGITDTDILQKPVNVVMAGDVPIKDRWREFDIRPLDLKSKPVATGSPTRRLRGDKPSFTVKTDKKGYD
jgi:hypothetical protein